uniref:Transmembrane protein 25 n=1 Tax=Mus musculus TaxID=10090 RepID=A0A1L1SR05_MOUSE
MELPLSQATLRHTLLLLPALLSSVPPSGCLLCSRSRGAGAAN